MSLRTPITAEILLGCYYSTAVPHNADAPAVREAVTKLISHGLIIKDDRWYATTLKGNFFVKHLLSIPFPIETWTIPIRPSIRVTCRSLCPSFG